MARGKNITATDERYFNKVMLLMLSRKEIICEDVREIVSNEPMRKNLIQGMKELGLVEIGIVYKPRKTYKISITSLGESVAKDIKRIMGKINREIDESEGEDFVVSSKTIRNLGKGE